MLGLAGVCWLILNRMDPKWAPGNGAMRREGGLLVYSELICRFKK